MSGALLALALQLGAASPQSPGESPKMGERKDLVGVVMDHIADSRTLEFQTPWGPKYEFAFPEWKIPIGSRVLDISITKHVFWMWFSSLLLLAVVLTGTSRRKGESVPKGPTNNIIETFVLFVRDDIAARNMDAHLAEEFTPYLCTIFFFILFCGLVGVLPFAATATGNIAVTASLALCTFVLTQFAGMRSQGVFGYWANLVPPGIPWWLYPLMIPAELLGLVTKPFALTIRLFANMVAGHVVILFLLGMVFVLGTVFVAPVGILFALGIYLLELLVILIQAYIFTILSAVFIGMAASHAH
jgi:F-type H+-transporting ATPase subunit a